MTVYLFDGTMDGLLTAVFDAYALKDQPEQLLKAGDVLPLFCDHSYQVTSDEEKAKITGLPSSLREALDELEKDHDYLTAGGVFPERLISQIIARNKKAASAVSKLPHPMEFAMYYDL